MIDFEVKEAGMDDRGFNVGTALVLSSNAGFSGESLLAKVLHILNSIQFDAGTMKKCMKRISAA